MPEVSAGELARRDRELTMAYAGAVLAAARLSPPEDEMGPALSALERAADALERPGES